MIRSHKNKDGFTVIEVENRQATAKLALQGAHLFHYQKQGEQPLLWCSKLRYFRHGKAIRGGMPICWPWFGKHPDDPALPQHGFARTSLFELVAMSEPDEDTTELVLQLKDSPESLALWPYLFRLRLVVVIGRTLSVALITLNQDQQPFTVSSALHTYFTVDHIDNVKVEGLAGATYLDTLTGKTVQQVGNIAINAEVDRVYHAAPLINLHDGVRTIQVRPEGSGSTVVWNPWQEKAESMADMDDYTTMLCIETANAMQDARLVAPGAEHTLRVELF